MTPKIEEKIMDLFEENNYTKGQLAQIYKADYDNIAEPPIPYKEAYAAVETILLRASLFQRR